MSGHDMQSASRVELGERRARLAGRPSPPPTRTNKCLFGEELPHDPVAATFVRFDRNRSGRLDYRELRNALQALGLDVSTVEAATVLAAYDDDGSGLMEIEEFARLCRRLSFGSGYGAAGVGTVDAAGHEGFGAGASPDKSNAPSVEAWTLGEAEANCDATPATAFSPAPAVDGPIAAKVAASLGLPPLMGSAGINAQRWAHAGGSLEAHDPVAATFVQFDRNKSGRLDYRELRNALRALGVDVSTAEAATVLAAYDDDGTGLMEIEEFARLCRRLGYGSGYGGPPETEEVPWLSYAAQPAVERGR